MNKFKDTIALVTGGGSGLGSELSKELARRGAFVMVADISWDAAVKVADEITAAGGRSRAIEVDVSQAVSLTEGIDRVVSEHGRLDYLFNNAGIILLGEVIDMQLEYWHRVISVNLLGVIYGTTAAYAHMVKQGSGHIVNIASVSGLVPMPTYTAYAATKHAVVGLSTSMRPEASRLGIKISVVCPGTMSTGMGAAARILRASRETLERNSRKKEAMNPAIAARAILRGVEKNERMIVFPFYARLLWWLHRIQPAFLTPLDTWFVKTLRAARTES